jgi:RNA polymerase sigma factor (sigma-70 family)
VRIVDWLPTPYAELERMSDAELVAHARERFADGEAGLETARLCVALVFERRIGLVRGHCAAKAPPGIVDDLASLVYERFVRAVYTQTAPMVNPSGLLVKMTRNVIASHFAKPRTDAVSHDDLPDVGLADDAYDEAEVAESVERLLSVLTRRQREVVWERVMEGRSSAEIAARLETTAGNVDVIFFRAMRKLREVVER